jgi:hypothetical protein
MQGKYERGRRRERRSFPSRSGERACEAAKAQESRRLRPKVKIWEAKRGTAFFVGRNRWGDGIRLGSLIGNRGSGETGLKGFVDHEEGGKLWRAKPKSVER